MKAKPGFYLLRTGWQIFMRRSRVEKGDSTPPVFRFPPIGESNKPRSSGLQGLQPK